MVNKPYGTNAETDLASSIDELDSARALLQFLRIQQHDFLNHIQVILAYLQLNKTKRAIEYIEDIIGQKQELATIYRLMDPEIAACLIGGMTKASFHQVTLQFNVESQWSLRKDSRRIAGLCTELMHIVIETAATLPKKNLLVKLQQGVEGYIIGFEINGPVDSQQLLEELEMLTISAVELGCSVNCQQTGEQCCVTCEIVGDSVKDKILVAEKR